MLRYLSFGTFDIEIKQEHVNAEIYKEAFIISLFSRTETIYDNYNPSYFKDIPLTTYM